MSPDIFRKSLGPVRKQPNTGMKVLWSPSIFRSSFFTTTTPHNVFAQAHDDQRRR